MVSRSQGQQLAVVGLGEKAREPCGVVNGDDDRAAAATGGVQSLPYPLEQHLGAKPEEEAQHFVLNF